MDFELNGTTYQPVLSRCYLWSACSGDVLHESPGKFSPVVSMHNATYNPGFTGAVILVLCQIA